MKLTEIRKKLTDLLVPLTVRKKKTPDTESARKGWVELNILAFKNAVLLPGSLLPLYTDGKESQDDPAQDALKRSLPVAAFPFEVFREVHPGQVCGGGRLVLVDIDAQQRKKILVEANERFRIREVLQREPFCKVLAETVQDIPLPQAEESRIHEELLRDVQKWIFLNPQLEDDLMRYLFLFEKSHQLADFVGNHFLPTVEFKQRLLEEPDCARRVGIIRKFLNEEMERFGAMSQISGEWINPVPISNMH